MRYLIQTLIGLLILCSFAFSQDNIERKPIPWAKTNSLDFCPEAKTFDFRNAYWLAAISYYAYWQPDQYDRIFSANFGQPVTVTFPPRSEDDAKKVITEGMGWKGRVNFFTSARSLPRSPSQPTDNYTSYYAAPLPFEACVKREKQWCFGQTPYARRSPMEEQECGKNLEKALMSFDRLQNITLLHTGGEMNPAEVKRASMDQARIEDIVRIYERKNNVKLQLDFTDRHFVERCEVYRNYNEFVPDTQAIWMESEKMVIISVRGTEAKNIIDWTTDLATAFQLNHPYLPFWKRNVHQGFEQSLDVMGDWLNEQINQLFNNYPHAEEIPVFVTGHSMGGALAVLVMTELLERNHKVSKSTQLNLKAIYTFGSPRIGNINFARYFKELNSESQVGFYRIVNKKDIITKAPCWDYTHFGTHIQIDESNEAKGRFDFTMNPFPEEHNYCAYGTALADSLFNAKEYANDHLLDSYYHSLVEGRQALLRALEKSGATTNNEKDYSYPANCRKLPLFDPEAPTYLNLNYGSLPMEIEEE